MNLLLSASSWYLNRRVIILNVISLLVIEFSYVEHLVVDGLITVIYLLSNTIAASIFLVRFRIFGLSHTNYTVSMNQEGISVSFIRR